MDDSARAIVGASASAEEADAESHKAKCRLAVCGKLDIDASALRYMLRVWDRNPAFLNVLLEPRHRISMKLPWLPVRIGRFKAADILIPSSSLYYWLDAGSRAWEKEHSDKMDRARIKAQRGDQYDELTLKPTAGCQVYDHVQDDGLCIGREPRNVHVGICGLWQSSPRLFLRWGDN